MKSKKKKVKVTLVDDLELEDDVIELADGILGVKVKPGQKYKKQTGKSTKRKLKEILQLKLK